ncbi:hypothetical protein N3114_12635 (plasmid) [Aliarcobacter butzleri]|uniref:Uncharacterized protein n=1 Tax=Aliarcobacter butzleri TaxID=28197 RepID=W0LZG6_9BACT|nr:hypothetical protein [Aliarcobacter butzleri]AHG28744.1 hypothetical protein [Aliarcobacter butzleri]UXC30736.1 hypothetical protein N3114_12635 [Aliarcobacter butzleri]
MKKGIITTSISSTKEFLKIDKLIDDLTLKAVEKVKEAKDFNIMTACLIDKKIIVVSEYNLPTSIYKSLKRQAYLLAEQ